jgi:hypothetical protein
MHVFKDSMWREIWKISQNFLGTKQDLSRHQVSRAAAAGGGIFCPELLGSSSLHACVVVSVRIPVGCGAGEQSAGACWPDSSAAAQHSQPGPGRHVGKTRRISVASGQGLTWRPTWEHYMSIMTVKNYCRPKLQTNLVQTCGTFDTEKAS